MTLPQTFTNFFQWLLVRKASSASEIRDWYPEYTDFQNQIDADVKLNRIKAVFRSDTTPVALISKNSNSVIHNGDVLASQTYNVPSIVADSIGMVFKVISDLSTRKIVLDAGTDEFYVAGISVGTTYTVSAETVEVSAIEAGRWDVQMIATAGGALNYQDFTPQSPNPAYGEGRFSYDDEFKCMVSRNDKSAVTMQHGRELWIRACNNTGVQINNGEVVYVSGADAGTDCPYVGLSKADDYDKDTVLAVATMDVPDTEEGEFTRFGLVNDFDTSSFSVGDILYLDIVAGQLTDTRPTFPAKPIVIGYCLKSHATEGKMLTVIETDRYDYEFDGTAIERPDVFVLESGGTVYAEVELDGGGDLPVQLDGDIHLLDCTTGTGVGGRARVALTPGSDIALEFNFVYVEMVGSVATLKSSVTSPTGAFAFIQYVSLWSAAKTATDGPGLFQRSTDAKAHGGRGRIAYIDDKLRQLGASWSAGVTPTAVITPQGGAPDDLNVTNTVGLVWQLHPQVFPALDISVDGCYVANASGLGTLTKYQKITNLNACLEDSAGGTLSGTRFNLTLIGAVNKTTGDCKLFVNLPSDSYSDDDDAYFDINNTAITTVDRELFSVAFLIARIPVKHTTPSSGTWEFINPAGRDEIISLLGNVMGSGAGGTGGGGGATNLNGLTDASYSTPVKGNALYYDGVSAFVGGAKVIENITTVSTATYTVLATDEVLDCQYDGPMVITAPDALKAIVGQTFTVSDRFRKSATINNIITNDESGNLIRKINSSGSAVAVQSNGTDWG